MSGQRTNYEPGEPLNLATNQRHTLVVPPPPPVIWARLYYEAGDTPLGEVDYRIEYDDSEITGRTSPGSVLFHEVDVTGFGTLYVGRFVGTVHARPAAWAQGPVDVRLRPRPQRVAELWIKLFDERGERPLTRTSFSLVLGAVTVEGITDDEGVLRVTELRPGFHSIRAGGRTGSAPARLVGASQAPLEVRMIGPDEFPPPSVSGCVAEGDGAD